MFAHFRRRIAIVAAQLLLLFHRAFGAVYLQGKAELVEVCRTHVLEKLIAPGAAETFVRLDGWTDAESPALLDRHQLLRPFQLYELLVVGDARQLQAIYFLVLAKHGVHGPLEHGVPGYAAHTVMPRVAACRKSGQGSGHSQNKNRRSDESSFSAHRVLIHFRLSDNLQYRY